jgi:hypothetical protein
MKYFVVLCLLIGFTMSTRLLTEARLRQAANITANATTATANVTGGDKIHEMISKVFFIDLAGKPGVDYIALKSADGLFLGCNNKTFNLSLMNKSPMLDDLWIPVLSKSDNKIALRNYWGGYLGLNNSQFDCRSRKIDEINKFTVDKNIDLQKLQLTDVKDKEEVLVLKIKDQFLGAMKDKVMPMKELNKTSVFMAPNKKADIKDIKGRYYFETIDMM